MKMLVAILSLGATLVFAGCRSYQGGLAQDPAGGDYGTVHAAPQTVNPETRPIPNPPLPPP